jgi:4-diphosphocytidyl-2-C-methyl-D-erythritol kinase
MVVSSAPAKINLSLEIEGRRDDGYHLIRTVMQAVDIRETVEICRVEKPGVNLRVSGFSLPMSRDNTVYKAVEAFFEDTGIRRFGLDIKVTKRIPVGAGLAGGSADAAATLVALNEMCGCGFSTDDLCEIGAKVGADVPFCIVGGTALGTGTGTELERLPLLPDCYIVIAKPPENVSTDKAYRLFDSAGVSFKSRAVEDGLKKGDLRAIARGLFNNFESVISLPGVLEIKAAMKRLGALGCQMTGSGSAVFGIFESAGPVESCAVELLEKFETVFVCRPDCEGARIEK